MLKFMAQLFIKPKIINKIFNIPVAIAIGVLFFCHESCGEGQTLAQDFQRSGEITKSEVEQRRAMLAKQIESGKIPNLKLTNNDSQKPQKFSQQQPNLFIRFYRSQISPAIGERCTLVPSCSEYFNQAWCKHGLIAVPMVADRFFREPDVNKHKHQPIIINNTIRYGDPVSDHDFWMK